ncbi:ABC transporter ATP-binding protein [uncultured Granulicatella sp.]|uniref:ABC transporter ATP-binding protein n=1 Tax=uncultured Granulicatella sp. TaxID=316089 RepID=UPI0028D74345|nr:ABC transporter ATP-binding protein [uncultured Granulicatella sp.]
MKHEKMEVYKKLFPYLKNYSVLLLFSLFLAIVSVLSSVWIPKVIGQTIDAMIGVGEVQFSIVTNGVLWIFVLALISMVSQYVMSLCHNHIAYGMVKSLRDDVFIHLSKMPLSYLDLKAHGSLQSIVISDTEQMADGLLLGFSQLFTGILTIISTLFWMFSIQLTMTIVVLLLTPISFVVASFIAKKTYDLFHDQSTLRAEQTAFTHETITGIKVVQAYSQEKNVLETFDKMNKKLADRSLKAIFYSSITNPATRFVNSLVYTVVGLVGAFFVLNSQLSIGQLAAFLTYANQYTKPFNEISGVMTEFQNSIACASRVFELMEEPVESEEGKEINLPEMIKGEVQFEQVSFSYQKDQSLIENFSLEVNPGEKIAIVGPTGSGKSTLINLLMRFYEVDKGSITIDGIPIKDMSRQQLRQLFGMVLQETWLQSGTIRENLILGNPNATDEEIQQVLMQCQLDKMIEKLPQGLETPLQRQGEDFSQGQRQLLSIARVMLSQPSMLILDEATSSIDTRTELKIQQAFQTLMEGKTSFIVAHRLSTIQNADKILVLKDGQVIEQGTHEELIARQGFYQHLYQSQWMNE